MSISDRPVAVTGADGFIGRHVVDALRSRGRRIVAWDVPDGDLTDRDQASELLEGERPGTIFHLAALGARPGEAHDPRAVTANVAMAVNLVGLAEQGTTLVMTGTMAEYGSAGVLAETDRCSPRTAYAIGKYVAGAYALDYGPRRGVTVRAARLFGAYGPGEHPDRLFPSLVRELKAGRGIPLSDGRQRRDFVHVNDIAEALVRLGDLPGDESFVVNVGTGRAVGVGDVCRWVAEALGADEGLLRFGARDRSPGDADLLEADTTRLESVLGWVPPQRLKPGLDPGLLS